MGKIMCFVEMIITRQDVGFHKFHQVKLYVVMHGHGADSYHKRPTAYHRWIAGELCCKYILFFLHLQTIMKEKGIKTNGLQAWLLAARPKTLTGAAVPVMMGLTLAFSHSNSFHAEGKPFQVIPAILCLLFAFVMQINANFINDYVDFRKGTDDETRLGPRRACAQGWITVGLMRRGIVLTSLLAAFIGLPLIYYGGLEMLFAGAICLLFCFLYTTHLSYMGLGDVLVIVFFGIIPVCLTYYLQTNTVTKEVFLSSLACGFVVENLLIVNNYRDRDNDKRAGKKTLVVRIGTIWTERLFRITGLVACHFGLVFFFQGQYFTFFLPFIYLLLHARTYRRMKRIGCGKALNTILAECARNIMVYGLLFCSGVLIDAFLLK